MYLIIRRMKAQAHLLEEARQRMKNGYVPILKSEPGFVEFYAVQVGKDEGVTISFFETQEAAVAANRKALDWAKESLAPLAQSPVEVIVVGEVLVHERREAE
jgi:heme-degrading monooxygenase HmoA